MIYKTIMFVVMFFLAVAALSCASRLGEISDSLVDIRFALVKPVAVIPDTTNGIYLDKP